MTLLNLMTLKYAPLLHLRDPSMKKTQPLSHFCKTMLKIDNPYREMIFFFMRGPREMLFFKSRSLTPALDYIFNRICFANYMFLLGLTVNEL